MEIEPLISGSKWTIFELLSERSHSPTELAERTKTSLANISQQLRLLEIAGLIKKEKQKGRQKGKPHMLFSLNEDYAYVVSMFKGFSRKKLFPVDDYHKIILKIWCTSDAKMHKAIEKFYLDAERHLDNISTIAISPDSKKIFVAVKSKDFEKKIKEIKTELEVETVVEKESAKLPTGYSMIYGNEKVSH